MTQKVTWCRSCLNMSTRPRIRFDEDGFCNACQWMNEKQQMDWSVRQNELTNLLNRYRSSNGFDCIVPVSGGKDGSYVSYNLKHKYGMNPLTVTVKPALSMPLGDENLSNFINSGYNHITISPDASILKKINKLGLIHKGFPYYGWLIAIKSAVIRTALNFNIPLIFYGEDGEVEYGGSSESKNKSIYDFDYIKRIYFEGGYDDIFNRLKETYPEVSESDLVFWKFPSEVEIGNRDLNITHWSYYEDWDSYRNYVVAKEHCGLKERSEGNEGTFTNFSQNDQALYFLHVYMMYLKFGFGRATQDAGIEIRRGSMTRDQAINLVRIYDNGYPENFIEAYLDYYEMSQSEFDEVLDKWANRELFQKLNGRWTPKFEVGVDFNI